MPRFLRKCPPNSIHYIYNKSTGNAPLFTDGKDKEEFIKLIKKYKLIYNFKIYSFRLLLNEYHLIIGVESDDEKIGISKIMQCIKCAYSLYYNAKYGKSGSNFNGRYRNDVIESNLELLIECRNINLMSDDDDVFNFIDGSFSSYKVLVGENFHEERLLDYKDLLNLISEDTNEATVIFKKFCNEEISDDDLLYVNQKPSPIEVGVHVNKKLSRKYILDVVSKVFPNLFTLLRLKTNQAVDLRAFLAFLFRCFRSLNCKEISKETYGINSEYNASIFSLYGITLLSIREYWNIYNEILEFATY